MGSPRFYVVLAVALVFCASVYARPETRDGLVEQLDEDNWDLMLTGEWMVEL